MMILMMKTMNRHVRNDVNVKQTGRIGRGRRIESKNDSKERLMYIKISDSTSFVNKILHWLLTMHTVCLPAKEMGLVRLNWLPVSFLLHVKYTLSYRIVCIHTHNFIHLLKKQHNYTQKNESEHLTNQQHETFKKRYLKSSSVV